LEAIPAGTRFLVVDDDSAVRDLVVADLRSSGITAEIITAIDGKEAFDYLCNMKLKSTPIEFIISDLEMPNVTGIEFLDLIKNSNMFTDVPFLMLTSVNDKTVVMKAIKLGANNYLLKPWNKQSFMEKVTFCWGKRKED
jgi:CheY-like chemotaxis protein